MEYVVEKISLRLLLRFGPRAANGFVFRLVVVKNILCCSGIVEGICHASREQLLNTYSDISQELYISFEKRPTARGTSRASARLIKYIA